MEFTLKIKSDNAAFEDNPCEEIARILRETAQAVARGDDAGWLFDINGNKVGRFESYDF